MYYIRLQLRKFPPLRQRSSSLSTDGLKKTGPTQPSFSFTLQQCLSEHTKEEVLGAGNEWYCNVCKEHKAAKKMQKFCPAYLPEVLILSLKRFEFRDVSSLVGRQGAAHREKIDTFVDFPLDGLDMAPYCAGEAATSGAASAAGTPTRVMYDLFAVCNHYGRMGFGHYTAVARDMHDWNGVSAASNVEWPAPVAAAAATASTGKESASGNGNELGGADMGGPWYCFDDRNVVTCAVEHVVTPEAYILFYRKRPESV